MRVRPRLQIGLDPESASLGKEDGALLATLSDDVHLGHVLIERLRSRRSASPIRTPVPRISSHSARRRTSVNLAGLDMRRSARFRRSVRYRMRQFTARKANLCRVYTVDFQGGRQNPRRFFRVARTLDCRAEDRFRSPIRSLMRSISNRIIDSTSLSPNVGISHEEKQSRCFSCVSLRTAVRLDHK